MTLVAGYFGRKSNFLARCTVSISVHSSEGVPSLYRSTGYNINGPNLNDPQINCSIHKRKLVYV
jgi:hypothetical protein